MKTRPTLSIILAVIAIVALVTAGWFAWLYYHHPDYQQPQDQSSTEQKQQNKSGGNQPPADSNSNAPSTSYMSSGGVKIIVDQPLSGSIIRSPQKVTGTVPGNWSFEARFTIRLLDANRQEIVSAPATLSGDWMTEDQVPFSAQLEFSRPATSQGYLVLEKSNPSDLPENNDQLEIPVKFY